MPTNSQLLTLVVAGINLIFIEGCSDSPSPSEFASGALAWCHVAVQSKLKSPTTAEFGLGDKEATKRDSASDSFEIRSTVDSENSFGAMLRSNFVCRWKHGGSGERLNIDNWDVESVDVF